MATRDRPVDRAAARARRDIAMIGEEVRVARMTSGLMQAQVGRAAGRSAAQVSRLERGLVGRIDVVVLAKVLAAAGMQLSIRAFPLGTPIRDAAHVALLGRVRQRLGGEWRWRLEVAVHAGADARAWDAVATCRDADVAFEAETRLYDVQAQIRRLSAKIAAGSPDRVILAVADTRHNRRVLRDVRELLRPDFPLDTKALWAALAANRDPGANGVLIL